MMVEAILLTETVFAVINEIITALIILAAIHRQYTRLLFRCLFHRSTFSPSYIILLELPFELFLLKLSLAFMMDFT